MSDYLADCEAEVRRKVETFPALWEHLTSPEFRRLLAEATAAL